MDDSLYAKNFLEGTGLGKKLEDREALRNIILETLTKEAIKAFQAKVREWNNPFIVMDLYIPKELISGLRNDDFPLFVENVKRYGYEITTIGKSSYASIWEACYIGLPLDS